MTTYTPVLNSFLKSVILSKLTNIEPVSFLLGCDENGEDPEYIFFYKFNDIIFPFRFDPINVIPDEDDTLVDVINYIEEEILNDIDYIKSVKFDHIDPTNKPQIKSEFINIILYEFKCFEKLFLFEEFNPRTLNREILQFIDELKTWNGSLIELRKLIYQKYGLPYDTLSHFITSKYNEDTIKEKVLKFYN